MNLSYLQNYINQKGRTKILFIWIPKTAGTSIYESLNDVLHMKRFLTLQEAKRSFTNLGANTFGHISINFLLEKKIIDASYYSQAFKFCISRNPYDRFVSLFYYMKRHKRISDELTMSNFIELIKNGVPPVAGYNFKGLSQCNKQVDWINDIELDAVFKFENLTTDILKLEDISNKKINLTHKNKSNKRSLNYIDELDQETIEGINEYYAEDFERFNYQQI